MSNEAHERGVADLGKSRFGCLLAPLALLAVVVTGGGFLLASGFVFSVAPELASLCLPAFGADIRAAAATYVPVFFGVIFIAAFAASIVERKGQGLWMKILIVPFLVAMAGLAGVFWLARTGMCPGISPPG